MKLFRILILILVFGALILLAAYLSLPSLFKPLSDRLSPTPSPLPTLVPTLPPVSPQAKTYTSERLGVIFSYLEDQGGEKIKILEENNRIYLYGQNLDPRSGQYLEVLQKNPQTGLPSAIQESLLANFSEDDCLVAVYPAVGYPQTYSQAQIEVPGQQTQPPSDLFAKWEKCPKDFTTQNGISYFLADSSRPGSYLYLSIGQYPILAGDNLPWQATVRFK